MTVFKKQRDTPVIKKICKRLCGIAFFGLYGL